MFNKPGSKIKGLAKVIFVIQVIAFSLGGAYAIYMGIDYEEFWLIPVGLAGIGVGILIAWLSVLFMYAFGSMVDDVEQIRIRLDNQGFQNNYQTDYQSNLQPDYQTDYPQSYPDYQP